MNNLIKFKTDLENLIEVSKLLQNDLLSRNKSHEQLTTSKAKKQEAKDEVSFENTYHSWYTESVAVIKQLIPDRTNEFIELYKGDGKRKTVLFENFNIQDWLRGMRANEQRATREKSFDDLAIVVMRFVNQAHILSSAKRRFTSSLMDIKQLVQADFFDSEIEVSKELVKKGYYRAAGAICGVVIEKHLSQVCSTHSISIARRSPTISDFNDNLKSNNVVEVSTWRFIQRLGDLRNLCAHNKDKEPTKDETMELIDGTDKLIKTLY